ncbi:MAG: CAAX prenyl protease-related protein [Bryobacteraceae bacterium]
MLSKPTSLKARNTGAEPPAVEHAAFDYIAPFALFICLLAIRRWFTPELFLSFRFVVITAVLAVFAPRVLPWRPRYFFSSIALGVLVFGIWIGPDRIFGAGYREFWLFHNPVTGAAVSTLPARVRGSAFFMTLRVIESVVLVPILEELFWRGWLMRWLIRADFTKVPLGTYTPNSFWIVAVLFAAEHGPYWEVGFIAGIAYNWWATRTRNLADCIVAHAVTNAVLAAYVLTFDQWQYWL